MGTGWKEKKRRNVCGACVQLAQVNASGRLREREERKKKQERKRGASERFTVKVQSILVDIYSRCMKDKYRRVSYLPHSYRGQHSSGDLTSVQFCPSTGFSVS